MRGLLGLGVAAALFAVSASPAEASSSTVTSNKVSCYVDAKTPSYLRNAKTYAVTVTGYYRISCSRQNGSTASSVNLSVKVGVGNVSSNGTYTTELADYTTSATYYFTALATDTPTMSFTCKNVQSGSETLRTRVQISLTSGTWTTLDYSSALTVDC